MRFGEMLRQARGAKGLTQAELGAEVYSPSFISLLEQGQRQPTPDMVRHFAAQLGMDVQTLGWWVESPAADDQPALATAMFAANYARDLQDDSLAASEAEHAAVIAHEQQNAPAWWDMSMLQAQSLISRRRLEEAEAVLRRMHTSSLLAPTPEMSSIVLGRLSIIARSLGRLDEAVALAQEAVQIVEHLADHDASVRFQATFILIAALSVKGDLDDAWDVATGLDLTPDSVTVPSLLIARGAWAVGNIAFRRGNIEKGREYHALAARLLLPQADLAAWAQFHRSSATLHLQAGLADASVRRSLDFAELGFTVIGTEAQRLELALALARYALLVGDLDTAGRFLGTVSGQRELLDFETLTDLEECLGMYYAALGSSRQAVHHFGEAARLHGEAGADEKARELTDQIRALDA
ncbi:hypothetical protein ASF21_08815 [Arthrobacter sp. Leaf234]|uniref:helix-turn-helix domain-containing protein n=1 Tax=Arthrobacter sp. Leaf234 TaxID=1736303 RepID=UPI0006FB6728|nr:helix-turn-helix transcriptional regulator [Arthrobacter sp. Leaf234]KQO01696.1 hypothetical protein ASF21_08815 [Arthrobacter sp. Leaf234]